MAVDYSYIFVIVVVVLRSTLCFSDYSFIALFIVFLQSVYHAYSSLQPRVLLPILCLGYLVVRVCWI